MAKSRQDLIDYALRSLGAPVLEINVDGDQLEDRVDEALEYWRLYHYDGIEKVYLKHKIKASRMTLSTAVSSQFALGSVLVGQTSGAEARVVEEAGAPVINNQVIINVMSGTFTNGETVSDGTNTAVLASTNAITLGEINTHYLELNDLVYGVQRVLPLTGTNMSKSMFDLQYQLRLNDLYDLTSTSIIYYNQVMSHLALLDMQLNGQPLFRFNRLQGRLNLDINWDGSLIGPGNYVVVECYRAMDPALFTKVWNEPWLKHYTTALIKRQWATNLKKFQGIQLHGGVTLDGQGMYIEAMQEIKDLEDELINKSAPLNFFLG